MTDNELKEYIFDNFTTFEVSKNLMLEIYKQVPVYKFFKQKRFKGKVKKRLNTKWRNRYGSKKMFSHYEKYQIDTARNIPEDFRDNKIEITWSRVPVVQAVFPSFTSSPNYAPSNFVGEPFQPKGNIKIRQIKNIKVSLSKLISFSELFGYEKNNVFFDLEVDRNLRRTFISNIEI